MKEDKVTLEERFDRIEQILEKMESGDISLDESFELYKLGLGEVKAANEMLDGVEKSMLVLNEEVKERFYESDGAGNCGSGIRNQ